MPIRPLISIKKLIVNRGINKAPKNNKAKENNIPLS